MSTNNLILQDSWLLALQLLIVALAFLPWLRTSPVRLSAPLVGVSAAVVIVLCYLGHYLVLLGYDLSRDEQLAVFDSRIYAQGRLAWPLAPAWQPFASALNLGFMLPVGHPVAWVSAYLPGNAMVRAAVGSVADPALTGPLLTGLCLPLIWVCARRLWPDDAAGSRAIAGACVLLLATSGQVIVTGMTAYAMPAHLFVNLLWLALFLQRRWPADIAALAVGFLGTGLHQPLFHPLFVAPWLLVLLAERSWRRLGLYAAGYGVIGLFWLSWPAHVASLVTGPASLGAAGVDYVDRLVQAFDIGWYNIAKTGLNLLRYFCWQNPLLLPLMIAGAVAGRRDRRILALLGGFLATLVILAVILPDQGHGFGYRYLHGVTGSAALVAACGLGKLQGEGGRWGPAFIHATILAAAVLLPVQALLAHAFYKPFAGANARIESSGADYVIIGAEDGPYSRDLVLNRPDLSNRPIRLSYEMAGDFPALARMICRPGVTVALPTDRFYGEMEYRMRYFTKRPKTRPSDRMAGERQELQRAGCATTLLD